MRHPKFEYFQGARRQWYWHLKAANGRIIAQGEGYKTKRACLKGIAALQVAVIHAGEPVEAK